MTRHVMEMLGMSKVTIEDGKVIDVTEPKVKYCPLFKKHRGIDELNCESVRKNAEFRIERFGMCNDNRDTRMKDFLSFGVSEMLSLALTEHLIDAAVIAADTNIASIFFIYSSLNLDTYSVCNTGNRFTLLH